MKDLLNYQFMIININSFLLKIVVILGILVGLNVIDCNLCVKGEDLDSQQGVIDFSLYLRSSSRASPEEDATNAIEGTGNMTAVLDQKNYIEELNRHLKYVENYPFELDCNLSIIFQCYCCKPTIKSRTTYYHKCSYEGGFSNCTQWFAHATS